MGNSCHPVAMTARIREVDRAVAYLREGLGMPEDAPYAEITWYPRGEEQARVFLAPVQQIGRQLDRLCRHFPEATVVLDKTSYDHPIGAIQCRCHPCGECPIHCKHHEDRPVVSVILRPVEEPLPKEEKLRLLKLMYSELHDMRVEPKRHGLAS